MRKSFLNFRLDFSQQLAITLIAGAIFLALATSVSIAIINAKSVKEQVTQQAIYLTDLIARQSRLSLLYKSETGAEEVANIALQLPDIAGIKIIADDGQVLFDNFSKEKVVTLPKNLSDTILASENEDDLLFIAPVITETIDVSIWEEEVETPAAQQAAIGYVYIYFSKEPLKAIQSEILRTNLWISAGAALLLLAAVLLLTRKMTKPLVALSKVMDRAQHGEIELRAEKKGPKDIVSMQESFNTMMEAIELRDKELRKARDLALETAAIKSQFAANVSHELRTPMNSVMGMLDLLSHMGLTGKNQEYVDTAKSSAENLLELIDDILSYVHADSGEIILENDLCDIEELMDGVINLLSTQALRKKAPVLNKDVFK